MQKSQRLTVSEIRDAFRLVGEVCERGADPLVWRSHLIQSLVLRIHAPVGFCQEEFVGQSLGESRVRDSVHTGLDTMGLAGLEVSTAEGGILVHPMFPTIQPFAHRSWTRTLHQIIPDDCTRYRSHVVSEDQCSSNVDDTIHSRQAIPQAGWVNMCAIFRGWNDPPFSKRDRNYVHLVHEELALVWSSPPSPDPIEKLPPRARAMIRLFRRGMGEKQVAIELGLSPQTIHTYVRNLHRQVNVNTRFELLERFKPSSRARPRLSFEADRRAENLDGFQVGFDARVVLETIS